MREATPSPAPTLARPAPADTAQSSTALPPDADLRTIWETLMAAASGTRSIAPLLPALRPVEVNAERLTLACPPSAAVTAPLAAKALSSLTLASLGRSLQVVVRPDAALTPENTPAPVVAPAVAVEASVQTAPAPAESEAPAPGQDLRSHPLVRQVAEALGARIVRVVPRSAAGVETAASGVEPRAETPSTMEPDET